MIGGSRGDILVIREARPDDASTYSCEAQHALTGEKRRSPSAMIAVSREYNTYSLKELFFLRIEYFIIFFISKYITFNDDTHSLNVNT